MVAQLVSNPLRKAADLEALASSPPALRLEEIVDVIARAVLSPIAPVDRRCLLLAEGLAGRIVIDRAVTTRRQTLDMPAEVACRMAGIPADIVVQIAGERTRTPMTALRAASDPR